MASDPAAAARGLSVEEARDNVARCALVYLLAERDLAEVSSQFSLPEAGKALDLAARTLTGAIDDTPLTPGGTR